MARGEVERRRRDYLENMYEWPMNVDNDMGIDCVSRGWAGWRKTKREKIGQLK